MKRSRRPVDVLLVRSATTGGHRRDENEADTLLRKLGYSVEQTVPRYRWTRVAGMLTPLNDLYEASCIRAATTRACRDVQPSVFVYTTPTGILLQPRSRIATGVLRFDALCRENRLGWRGVWQRALERRALRDAAVLAPRSIQDVVGRKDLRLFPLPPVVIPVAGSRLGGSPRVVFYAGNNPHKKGLDVAVEAWSRSSTGAHELWVTGIEATVGARYLDSHSISVPASLRWAGVLPPSEFRNLVSTAAAYISASRYEDFGIAQVEAVADGVPVVSVPSAGPAEVLQILHEAAPELIAGAVDAKSLSITIEHVLNWNSDRRTEYQQSAVMLTEGYSHDAVMGHWQAVMGLMTGLTNRMCRPPSPC